MPSNTTLTELRLVPVVEFEPSAVGVENFCEVHQRELGTVEQCQALARRLVFGS